MTEDPTKPAQDTGDASGNATDAVAEVAGEDPTSVLVAENERLEAEVAALKDKFLRAFAEADNVRRRAEREVADAKVYGVTGFARDLLTVADDFGRALGAVTPDVRAAADGTLKTVLDGIELTARALDRALEKHGVSRIEAEGAKFDPNRHQAIFEVPNPSVPAGTVVQVVQPGYVIGTRVLRPAMVGVSKGGPKEAATKEAAESAGSDPQAGV
ncbi:MAG TPA: nucleotide exchange factor GrpE [Xanthobacteraceae bacterium]|nr:nucleotide exchange factor GrpE [Xanthobacteraceae bacterium]